MRLRSLVPFLLILIVIGIFFHQFILQGKLPIPSDTIIGLYHPFRDLYREQYQSGIPYKNFLITDPVRQQFVWRKLAIESWSKGEIPWWNSYSFAGYPLLANLQTAAFYPLNILFAFFNFELAWSILVLLQPILGGIFFYLLMRNWSLSKIASFFGSIVWIFSGFWVAWLEWNTILHTALWLPLILLSIDKIAGWISKPKISNLLFWIFVFIVSLVSSFFAGHLQTFFYVLIMVLFYFSALANTPRLDAGISATLPKAEQSRKSSPPRRLRRGGRQFSAVLHRVVEKKRLIEVMVGAGVIAALITSVQWLPVWQFLSLSARNFDQANWQREDWFLPWQHLIQFIAPDFFGNPATLNYWGVWNYGEFVGYIGIIPLFFALVGLLSKNQKRNFMAILLLMALIFALPTPLAKLPYQWQIPFLSTAQPSRLMMVIDFCLAALAAFGFDKLSRTKILNKKQVLAALSLVFISLGTGWLIVFFGKSPHLAVARRNLIVPTGFFIISAVLLLAVDFFRIRRKNQGLKLLIVCSLLIVTTVDLLRFGWKFTPFTKKEYLFPTTAAIGFLQKEQGVFRIMNMDRRILPPNFSLAYNLQTVEGYDPLYLRNYGELVAVWTRRKADISPASFNRILTPQNYQSHIADLLNVKYILSLDELDSAKLIKVFEEGETKVYENKFVLPRTFLVNKVILVDNKAAAIEAMFDKEIDLRQTAVVELVSRDEWEQQTEFVSDENDRVEIIDYQPNRVVLTMENAYKQFLVLTDSYYPGWKVFVDGREEKVYKVNYNFRGVLVPEGEHRVIFKYQLF